MLPVFYLAGRGDLMLLISWRDAVAKGECGIIAAARGCAASEALIPPFNSGSRRVYSLLGT
jgi:hypothetical protein